MPKVDICKGLVRGKPIGNTMKNLWKMFTSKRLPQLKLIVGKGGVFMPGDNCGNACLVAVFLSAVPFTFYTLSESSQIIRMQTYGTRKIFSNLRPFANSSTNLSKYLIFCVNGSSISSTR